MANNQRTKTAVERRDVMRLRNGLRNRTCQAANYVIGYVKTGLNLRNQLRQQEIGATEIGTAEIGTAEIGAAGNWGSRKLGQQEIEAAEIGATEIGATGN